MRSEQFLRITRLLGEELVEVLHTKTVMVVGLGAVGGMCLESLVRCGIGRLILVDFDTVGITNLNRQILATYDTLGMPKTEVAKQRVLSINPECEVKTLSLFVQEQTMDQIFSEKVDLIVDAIDSLNPKCTLLQTAYERNIPVVSSMGAALRRDPSLIRTGDLMDTYGCPLAKQVRSNLRKRGISRGIEVVFSRNWCDTPIKILTKKRMLISTNKSATKEGNAMYWVAFLPSLPYSGRTSRTWL